MENISDRDEDMAVGRWRGETESKFTDWEDDMEEKNANLFIGVEIQPAHSMSNRVLWT